MTTAVNQSQHLESYVIELLYRKDYSTKLFQNCVFYTVGFEVIMHHNTFLEKNEYDSWI